jgi:hypothetical protein
VLRRQDDEPELVAVRHLGRVGGQVHRRSPAPGPADDVEPAQHLGGDVLGMQPGGVVARGPRRVGLASVFHRDDGRSSVIPVKT